LTPTSYGRVAVRTFIAMGLGVVLASHVAWAQESLGAKERAAADTVAQFIARSRAQNGLPKLRRIKDGHLQAEACRRAKQGDKSLGDSTGIGPPEKVGILSAMWYSTLDPDQPPPELLDWAKGPGQQHEQPHRFAVGVCLVIASEHSEQRYWIVVGTYMSAIKSMLNIPTWG